MTGVVSWGLLLEKNAKNMWDLGVSENRIYLPTGYFNDLMIKQWI